MSSTSKWKAAIAALSFCPDCCGIDAGARRVEDNNTDSSGLRGDRTIGQSLRTSHRHLFQQWLRLCRLVHARRRFHR